MVYTVGEMAALLGVAPSTLRYYDREGLLPFVERSPGGQRIFREKDYEWLQVIGCLKGTGMPLRDIRAYIEMAMRGDETIGARFALIRRRREAVQAQMEALRQMLEALDYKCWYYETAQAAGTTAVPREMPDEALPEHLRAVRARLRVPPKVGEESAK